MKGKNEKKASIPIAAPISGRLVSIEKVPDPVFGEKVLGDGIAIIPENGKIVSPVNGKITSVSDSLHAYNIESDDGLQILNHIGLETVGLKGEGFKTLVKAGDVVRVGDKLGEVDLEVLKSKNINPITSLILCDAPEGTAIDTKEGAVIAGKSTAFSVIDELSKGAVESDDGKTRSLNRGAAFDFLQKLGKVLMVVIAVMPAAGIMISIGKLIAMSGTQNTIITNASAIL